MMTAIPNESIRNRQGLVRISKSQIEQVVNRTNTTAQAAWNAMMQDFVIMEARRCVFDDTVEYCGYHPQFEELCEVRPFEPPAYDVHITTRQEANNITTVEARFVRVP